MGSLKFGLRDSEGISDDAVFDACKTVNIHDKILKLKGGYYAPVDQNVCGLDREETKRIIFARSLLQKPRIIICVGAITALHTETDRELKKALKASFDGRTVLVIE